MLSNSQLPPPREEVAALAARSSVGRSVPFVTTRIVRDLVPGESVVAFYGDASLDNALLGYGVFERSVPIDSPDGAAVARGDALYGHAGMPAGAKSVLLLRDVRIAQASETLESLKGVIDSNGKTLSLANLPNSAARIQVYYTRRH